MEDRRAFLIEGKWELDGIEDQQATRVVHAIRSRRYVNQREIPAALGINQATVARALKRAVNLGLITEKEVEECAKAARALRDDTVRVAIGDEGDNPDF